MSTLKAGDNKDSKKSLPAISLGLNMAAGMAAFSALGYYWDQKSAKGYQWTLVGMFLGLFYCGYEVWKIVKEANKKDGSKPS